MLGKSRDRAVVQSKVKKIKKITISFSLLVLVFLFFQNAPKANASIIDNIKFLLSDSAKNKISLDSKISHAPQGDLNNDGMFDSGEIIKFVYIINNPTNKEVSFATLKTNIAKGNINFIHDIKGTSSLSDKNKTIIIPNLRINPGEKLEISFNARLNYFNDSDKLISTEPEIITSDKKSLLKSKRKEVNAKKFKNKLPSSTESRKK